MNAKEFVAYITQHMTAEEALTKLIEGSLIQYESLKFDKENGEPVHPILIVTMAAMDMGWQIAVDKSNEDMIGLVVGTEEYMNKIFQKEE